jgi:hypothetical protein
MAVPTSRSFEIEVLAPAGTDIAAVDALARLALAARRLGLALRVANAPAELLELLAFAGLSETLGVQAVREPEQREQPVGVEEESQLRDPPR